MHASPHLPCEEGYFSWQNPLHSGRKRVLLEEVIHEEAALSGGSQQHSLEWSRECARGIAH